MLLNPILIGSPTRCGTTMLAWLLHLHGVWIGKAQVTKSPETNPLVGTENEAIRNLLKARQVHSFRSQLCKIVPHDTPWLVKTANNLIRRNLWLGYFPDARWLCPQRPIEDILASKSKHPGMAHHRPSRHRAITEEQLIWQKEILKTAKYAKEVDMNLVCSGKGEQEAREAIEFCGLDFKPEIYHEWVQPDRWHPLGRS